MTRFFITIAAIALIAGCSQTPTTTATQAITVQAGADTQYEFLIPAGWSRIDADTWGDGDGAARVNFWIHAIDTEPTPASDPLMISTIEAEAKRGRVWILTHDAHGRDVFVTTDHREQLSVRHFHRDGRHISIRAAITPDTDSVLATAVESARRIDGGKS